MAADRQTEPFLLLDLPDGISKPQGRSLTAASLACHPMHPLPKAS